MEEVIIAIIKFIIVISEMNYIKLTIIFTIEKRMLPTVTMANFNFLNCESDINCYFMDCTY